MLKLKDHRMSFYIFCALVFIRIVLLILDLSLGLKLLGLYTIDIINFCTLLSALLATGRRFKTIVYPVVFSLIALNIVFLMFKFDTKEIHIKTPNNKDTLVVMESFKLRLVKSDLYKISFGIFKKSLALSVTSNEADRTFTNKEYTLTQKSEHVFHLTLQEAMPKELDINFNEAN